VSEWCGAAAGAGEFCKRLNCQTFPVPRQIRGISYSWLKDTYHRPHAPELTEEAKAWVVRLACTKPKDHGRAAEVWSISALAEFVASHASKETRAFLATRPGRFEYVHTPKHGSWLNLTECAFSKMARTFLRHMRVKSLDELKARIRQGIDEMNAAPVVFRWKKFDLAKTGSQ